MPRIEDFQGINYGGFTGLYSANFITGLTTGMAANAPIAAIRWGSATAKFVLLRVRTTIVTTTAFGTAQGVDLEAIKATAFSASDTGGTAVTPPPKRSSLYGASLVTDARVATTAALSAGTRTLDNVGFAAVGAASATVGTSLATTDMYNERGSDGEPVVLEAANQGIIFRVPTAQGATGVVKYFITVEWAEVGQV